MRKSRKRESTSRGSEAKRPTWGQMFCTALLFSPAGAVARMLAPPQNPGRNLLGTCTVGPWGPSVVGSQTGLNTQLPAIQRVDTVNTWINIRNNSCATGGREFAPAHNLTYAFDSAVSSDEPFEPLSDDMQDTVRQDLATLSQSLNLTFHEINAAPIGRANLLFFRSRSPDAGSPPWLATSPGALVNPDVAGVFQNVDPGAASDRLAAIGTALGLTGKGQVGYNNTNGNPGKFISNTMSSVTFARENTCVNVDQFGPLDLGALALKYEANDINTTEIYDVRDGQGVAGLLTSKAYDRSGIAGNTLRAIYNGSLPLQLSLDAFGGSFTKVGSTYRTLAPGSQAQIADISQTQGGIVIGSNFPNTLVGSPYNDTFRVGLGSTRITLGAGADSVILQDTANVTVTDFTAQDTLYAPWLTNTSGIVATANSQGSTVELPSSATVALPGFKSFSVAANLKVGTNPPNNFIAPPCLLEQSANVSSPPPPMPQAPPSTTTTVTTGNNPTAAGNNNPCASIGTPGLGASIDTCAAQAHIPYMPVIWDP